MTLRVRMKHAPLYPIIARVWNGAGITFKASAAERLRELAPRRRRRK